MRTHQRWLQAIARHFNVRIAAAGSNSSLVVSAVASTGGETNVDVSGATKTGVDVAGALADEDEGDDCTTASKTGVAATIAGRCSGESDGADGNDNGKDADAGAADALADEDGGDDGTTESETGVAATKAGCRSEESNDADGYGNGMDVGAVKSHSPHRYYRSFRFLGLLGS